ncbi:hypothetical protein THRCLA_10091 [Thraustotheca clavata]|uniref:Uncharacterized protein n=1 Tax=Thraustotheca clavata TaxID=74557 RepID=A0A1V9YSJ8_9STRA|nr:hypothetical protein THRCLA_10091 [Thraustotheca clavata]
MAAALGDLDTMKLLHQTGIECCTAEPMNLAASINRRDIFEWLHTHRTEGYDNNAMTYAVARGHIEMVKWLHEAWGLPCTQKGLCTAANNGDFDMVLYLTSIPMAPLDSHDNCPGCVPTLDNGSYHQIYPGNAIDKAAFNGHIDIIKILHNYPATTEAMDAVAGYGHLELVNGYE